MAGPSGSPSPSGAITDPAAAWPAFAGLPACPRLRTLPIPVIDPNGDPHWAEGEIKQDMTDRFGPTVGRSSRGSSRAGPPPRRTYSFDSARRASPPAFARTASLDYPTRSERSRRGHASGLRQERSGGLRRARRLRVPARRDDGVAVAGAVRRRATGGRRTRGCRRDRRRGTGGLATVRRRKRPRPRRDSTGVQRLVPVGPDDPGRSQPVSGQVTSTEAWTVAPADSVRRPARSPTAADAVAAANDQLARLEPPSRRDPGQGTDRGARRRRGRRRPGRRARREAPRAIARSDRPGRRGPDGPGRPRRRAAGPCRRHARPGLPKRTSETAGGAVTSLPALGTTVARGETLYALDGRPTVLLIGTVPAYRALREGDSGPDVAQLQANLVALGARRVAGAPDRRNVRSRHDAGGPALADDRATSRRPGSSSRRRDRAPGRGPCGQRARRDRWRGPAGRAHARPHVGRRDRQARGRPASCAIHPPGDQIRFTTTDGTAIPGTIVSVAAVAVAPPATGNGPPQRAVGGGHRRRDRSGRPRRPRGTDLLADVTTGTAPDVLAVPVAALVVLADGSFGVEVAAAGTTHFVRVTPGIYDQTMVEIRATASRPATRSWSRHERRSEPAPRSSASSGSPRSIPARRRPSPCRTSPSMSTRASSSGSSARRAPASRRCSGSWAPSSGRPPAACIVHGEDVTALPDRALSGLRATSIGFVFQQFFLLDGLTAWENVAQGMLYRGIAGPRATAAGDRGARAGRARPPGDATARASCRAASGSGSRSPGRSSGDRRSSSPTSRPAASTASPVPRSSSLLRELNRAGTTIAVITHSEPVAAAATRRIRILDGRVAA